MRIETPRQIGALLRDRRIKAQLTQQALADRVDVSLRWIRRAEQGSPGVAIGKLLRALTVVGVTLETPSTSSRQVPRIDVPDVNAIIAAASGKPRRKGSR